MKEHLPGILKGLDGDIFRSTSGNAALIRVVASESEGQHAEIELYTDWSRPISASDQEEIEWYVKEKVRRLTESSIALSDVAGRRNANAN